MSEGTELQVQEQAPFLAMDQAESMELFDAFLAGQAEIDTYVYHIQIQTKKGAHDVYGLSLPGCTASLRNKCAQRVEKKQKPYDLYFNTAEDRYDDEEDGWLCEVQIKDRTTGMIGVGRVCEAKFFDEAKQKPNRFCRRIAFSKAKRNAIRDFLDEEFIKMMIQLFIQQGKARKLDPNIARAKRVEGLIAATVYEDDKPKPKRGRPAGSKNGAKKPEVSKPSVSDGPMTEQEQRAARMEEIFDAHDIPHDGGWASLRKHIRPSINEDNITEAEIGFAKELIEKKDAPKTEPTNGSLLQ